MLSKQGNLISSFYSSCNISFFILSLKRQRFVPNPSNQTSNSEPSQHNELKNSETHQENHFRTPHSVPHRNSKRNSKDRIDTSPHGGNHRSCSG